MLGYILNKLYGLRFKYLTRKNSRSVHNLGGRISGDSVISCPENIYIGKNSYVNGGHLRASKNNKIFIGDNCLISYNVNIRTDMHNYINKNVCINQQGHRYADIVIEDDVWIGFGAQIMPGCTIKKGCVIGAGAIVTKSTEEYGVYVGVPAKLIKYREE